MTPRGLLLSLGVLAVFLALFVPLARSVLGGTHAEIDAARLRRTFVALSLYGAEHDGLPAPNIGLVRRDLDPSDLQSVDDPHSGGPGPFPIDPALPDLRATSPDRVSWSYRWHWKEAGEPATVMLDRRRGLLADPWTDRVLRVNVDGAMLTTPRAVPTTFAGLFGR